MDECTGKPLPPLRRCTLSSDHSIHDKPPARDLHSFTLQLNVSVFGVQGVRSGVVQGVFRGLKGMLGGVEGVCRACVGCAFVSDSA